MHIKKSNKKNAVILYSNNTVKYCFETFLVVAVSPASNGDFCMGCRNIFKCVTQGHILSVPLWKKYLDWQLWPRRTENFSTTAPPRVKVAWDSSISLGAGMAWSDTQSLGFTFRMWTMWDVRMSSSSAWQMSWSPSVTNSNW